MTELRYLLDTDIASFIMRDENAVLRQKLRFVPPAHIAVSVVTQAELLAGLKALPHFDARKTSVFNFLQRATILPWTSPAAEAYADVRFSLKHTGKLIGALDMLIAAHAISANLILVSNNTSRFSRLVPALQLENWTLP